MIFFTRFTLFLFRPLLISYPGVSASSSALSCQSKHKGQIQSECLLYGKREGKIRRSAHSKEEGKAGKQSGKAKIKQKKSPGASSGRLFALYWSKSLRQKLKKPFSAWKKGSKHQYRLWITSDQHRQQAGFCPRSLAMYAEEFIGVYSAGTAKAPNSSLMKSLMSSDFKTSTRATTAGSSFLASLTAMIFW